jgi:hypothetical protein
LAALSTCLNRPVAGYADRRRLRSRPTPMHSARKPTISNPTRQRRDNPSP